jgi:hypothetical protein
MSYTGTLLKDLQSMVEACLQSNDRICVICWQRYGDHSRVGAYCPDSASAGLLNFQTCFAERCGDNQAREGTHAQPFEIPGT